MANDFDEYIDDSTKLETCENCNGTGEEDLSDYNDPEPLMGTCLDCGGEGFYERS